MREFKFEKLVRDKIVEDMIAGGDTPKWKKLTDSEFINELKRKIIEESVEVPTAQGEDLIKELADLQELMDNLLEAVSVTKEEFIKIQNKKNEKAGSFKKRQFISTVQVKEDSKWINYYLENSDRYPEIKKVRQKL